ncbi:MAG: hypothetical protein KDC87_21315 [Planctomycetes bacterium]|nr:hypothetical protein [Planctomycetota bacterium]
MPAATALRLLPAFFLPLAATTLLGAQATWQAVNPPSGPAARSGASAMVTLSDVEMFGGRTAAGVSSELWTFDMSTSTWSQQLISGPLARDKSVLVYDLTNYRGVLFGGRNAQGAALADTWLLTTPTSRYTWTDAKPTVAPAARFDAAAEWDPNTRRVVLFGGSDGTRFFGDTWSWDGKVWTQLAPSASPPARAGARLVYDSARLRLLLFGGEDASGVRGDTWSWNGVTWQPVPTATIPGAGKGLTDYCATFDPVRDRLVLFGGFDGTGLGRNTWEFDGQDWIDRGVSAAATARRGAVLGCTPLPTPGGVSAMFGGLASTPLGDTLRYASPYLAAVSQGSGGCFSTSHGVGLTVPDLPWVGQTMRVELSPVAPSQIGLVFLGTTLNAFPGYPFAPDPTCVLYVVPLLQVILPPPVNSKSTWAVAIPNTPVLSGVRFRMQGAKFDATGPVPVLSVTDYFGVLVGMK